MHVINSLFQMRESAANCGGDRHVDVRCCIIALAIIVRTKSSTPDQY